MSSSALALLGFAAWTLFLLGLIAVLRSGLVLTGARPANAFSPSGTDVSEFSGRLCRAHANCYENLPVFAAVILVAITSGASSLTDPLALWFLAARIGQSVVHLVSTSPLAVTLRFGLFLVQYVILVWFVLRLVLGT